MTDNVIDIANAKSVNLLDKLIPIIEKGIQKDLHSVFVTFLPFMTNPKYTGYVTGRWIALMEEVLGSLRNMRTNGNDIKHTQYEILSEFVKHWTSPTDTSHVPLVLWYDNGNNLQIRFVPFCGFAVPVIGYLNSENIIDQYITDCAIYYNVTRDEIINLNTEHENN